MCTGMELASIGQSTGTALQGYSAQQAGRAQGVVLSAQAIAERDAANAAASKVRETTARTAASARATSAASGVDVGSGSALDAQRDILQRGLSDAEMTLLTGERRARDLEFGGQNARAEGNAAFQSALMRGFNQQLAPRWRGSIYRQPYEESAPIVDRSRGPLG